MLFLRLTGAIVARPTDWSIMRAIVAAERE